MSPIIGPSCIRPSDHREYIKRQRRSANIIILPDITRGQSSARRRRAYFLSPAGRSSSRPRLELTVQSSASTPCSAPRSSPLILLRATACVLRPFNHVNEVLFYYSLTQPTPLFLSPLIPAVYAVPSRADRWDNLSPAFGCQPALVYSALTSATVTLS